MTGSLDIPGGISSPVEVKRPGWDEYFMLLAEQAAKRGTCSRLQVGAVVVQNFRVIGTGYNGAPKNTDHCVHYDDTPCEISVHAEANALLHMRSDEGAWGCPTLMYCTHMPCFECSKLILNTPITTVYYREWYGRNAGHDLLATGGVRIVRVP